MKSAVKMTKLTVRSIDSMSASKCRLQTGDLLVEKSGGGDATPVGAVVIFDHEFDAVCSNFIAKMTPSEEFDSHFLNFAHKALYGIGVNVLNIKQTTGIQNLDLNAYLATKFGFPPLAEQRDISDHVVRNTKRIDTSVDLIRRQIQLINAYRTRLIADVVTGKLDVREAAANLSDEKDDEETIELDRVLNDVGTDGLPVENVGTAV